MLNTLKTKTWVNVLILSIITFGIYIPFWFKHMKQATDQLPEVKKLDQRMIKALLIVSILAIPLNITVTTTVNGISHGFSTNYFGIGSLLSLARFLLIIFLSFDIRKMLVQLYHVEVNEVLTFLLGPIYLQYKLHNLPDNPIMPAQAAPIPPSQPPLIA